LAWWPANRKHQEEFHAARFGAWLQDVAENVDRLTIEQLLDLHDLVLAPLCPATKRRIVGAAALPALPPAGEASLPIAA